MLQTDINELLTLEDTNHIFDIKPIKETNKPTKKPSLKNCKLNKNNKVSDTSYKQKKERHWMIKHKQ